MRVKYSRMGGEAALKFFIWALALSIVMGNTVLATPNGTNVNDLDPAMPITPLQGLAIPLRESTTISPGLSPQGDTSMQPPTNEKQERQPKVELNGLPNPEPEDQLKKNTLPSDAPKDKTWVLPGSREAGGQDKHLSEFSLTTVTASPDITTVQAAYSSTLSPEYVLQGRLESVQFLITNNGTPVAAAELRDESGVVVGTTDASGRATIEINGKDYLRRYSVRLDGQYLGDIPVPVLSDTRRLFIGRLHDSTGYSELDERSYLTLDRGGYGTYVLRGLDGQYVQYSFVDDNPPGSTHQIKSLFYGNLGERAYIILKEFDYANLAPYQVNYVDINIEDYPSIAADEVTATLDGQLLTLDQIGVFPDMIWPYHSNVAWTTWSPQMRIHVTPMVHSLYVRGSTNSGQPVILTVPEVDFSRPVAVVINEQMGNLVDVGAEYLDTNVNPDPSVRVSLRPYVKEMVTRPLYGQFLLNKSTAGVAIVQVEYVDGSGYGFQTADYTQRLPLTGDKLYQVGGQLRAQAAEVTGELKAHQRLQIEDNIVDQYGNQLTDYWPGSIRYRVQISDQYGRNVLDQTRYLGDVVTWYPSAAGEYTVNYSADLGRYGVVQNSSTVVLPEQRYDIQLSQEWVQQGTTQNVQATISLNGNGVAGAQITAPNGGRTVVTDSNGQATINVNGQDGRYIQRFSVSLNSQRGDILIPVLSANRRAYVVVVDDGTTTFLNGNTSMRVDGANWLSYGGRDLNGYNIQCNVIEQSSQAETGEIEIIAQGKFDDQCSYVLTKQFPYGELLPSTINQVRVMLDERYSVNPSMIEASVDGTPLQDIRVAVYPDVDPGRYYDDRQYAEYMSNPEGKMYVSPSTYSVMVLGIDTAGETVILPIEQVDFSRATVPTIDETSANLVIVNGVFHDFTNPSAPDKESWLAPAVKNMTFWTNFSSFRISKNVALIVRASGRGADGSEYQFETGDTSLVAANRTFNYGGPLTAELALVKGELVSQSEVEFSSNVRDAYGNRVVSGPGGLYNLTVKDANDQTVFNSQARWYGHVWWWPNQSGEYQVEYSIDCGPVGQLSNSSSLTIASNSYGLELSKDWVTEGTQETITATVTRSGRPVSGVAIRDSWGFSTVTDADGQAELTINGERGVRWYTAFANSQNIGSIIIPVLDERSRAFTVRVKGPSGNYALGTSATIHVANCDLSMINTRALSGEGLAVVWLRPWDGFDLAGFDATIQGDVDDRTKYAIIKSLNYETLSPKQVNKFEVDLNDYTAISLGNITVTQDGTPVADKQVAVYPDVRSSTNNGWYDFMELADNSQGSIYVSPGSYSMFVSYQDASGCSVLLPTANIDFTQNPKPAMVVSSADLVILDTAFYDQNNAANPSIIPTIYPFVGNVLYPQGLTRFKTVKGQAGAAAIRFVDSDGFLYQYETPDFPDRRYATASGTIRVGGALRAENALLLTEPRVGDFLRIRPNLLDAYGNRLNNSDQNLSYDVIIKNSAGDTVCTFNSRWIGHDVWWMPRATGTYTITYSSSASKYGRLENTSTITVEKGHYDLTVNKEWVALGETEAITMRVTKDGLGEAGIRIFDESGGLVGTTDDDGNVTVEAVATNPDIYFVRFTAAVGYLTGDVIIPVLSQERRALSLYLQESDATTVINSQHQLTLNKGTSYTVDSRALNGENLSYSVITMEKGMPDVQAIIPVFDGDNLVKDIGANYLLPNKVNKVYIDPAQENQDPPKSKPPKDEE